MEIGLSEHANKYPPNCLAVSSSASPWPAPWPPAPGLLLLDSRFRHSMHGCAATCAEIRRLQQQLGVTDSGVAAGVFAGGALGVGAGRLDVYPEKGVLDFAGGTVVHINAGIAGLVCAFVLGKRVGFGPPACLSHTKPFGSPALITTMPPKFSNVQPPAPSAPPAGIHQQRHQRSW